MKEPNLGLVCITSTDEVRFRTITRKRLLSLNQSEAITTLESLYEDNLSRLEKALEFCNKNKIKLYRMTSNLFPFADDEIGENILKQLETKLSQVGTKFNNSGIRLVIHPEQFVVLSSDSEDVINNSLKILRMHALVMDLLEQPQSCWSVMNIHGGKANRKEKLVENIRNLPREIQSRLTLENDEHSYGAWDIIDICLKSGVSMVFDAHHHLCHQKLQNYNHESMKEITMAAKQTWCVPEWQLVHISNGREFLHDKAHHDLIGEMPEAFREVPWIEVEAKSKEVAICALEENWLQKIK